MALQLALATLSGRDVVAQPFALCLDALLSVHDDG